jgi:tetratricopeptide (TPR) repeat protein
MKTIHIFLAILLSSQFLTAQGLRNGQDQIGRDVTARSFGNDNLWHLRQAEILISQQNIERALFELDLAVAQDPYLAKAYLLRAKLKKQIGMQTEARQDLQTALRLNPYAADIYGYNGPFGQLNLLATQARIDISGDDASRLQPYYDWLDQMNTSLAEKDFVFTSAAPSMELDHLEAAVWHLERENRQAALAEVEKALSLNPSSPIAHDLKGMIFLQQERWEEAKASLLEATRLAPNFAMAWFNLSRVHQAQGDRAGALEHLNKAIRLQEELPAQESETYLQAYLDRGLTRKMLGDFGGALADINLVMKSEGETPELLKTRGNIYLIYGLYNKALLDFSTAIQKNPDSAEVWYNRGITHLLNGDALSACSDFEKSAGMGFEKAKEKQRYFCVY